MNAGETSTRVYVALKERVIAGGFRSGERLDPARLAEELSSSTTPVRDALLRLTGERLVESWRQEGFRQPIWSEGAIRDLYIWGDQLTKLIARSAIRSIDCAQPPPMIDGDYVARVAGGLHQIAAVSPNREHRVAIDSLLDRSRRCHSVEAEFLDEPIKHVDDINAAFGSGDWVRLRAALQRLLAGRLRIITAVANAII